jgi:hypothetical protein
LPVLQQGSGQVVAVFQSSMYLQSAAGLCCIGAASLPQGPLNATTTLDGFNHLTTTGSHWRFVSNCIMLKPATVIDTANASHWSSPLVAESYPVAYNLKLAASTIEQALLRSSQSTGSAIAAAVNARINHSEQQLTAWLAGSAETGPDFIADLLGCGDGLTPAGDDLLLGAVVTLRYFHAEHTASVLANAINRLAATKTNLISQAHLSAAGDGQANELLMNLLHACAEPNQLNLQPFVKKLLHYGHSSGRYTLRGVLIALTSVAITAGGGCNSETS